MAEMVLQQPLRADGKEPNFLQKFGYGFVHGDIFTKLSFLIWGLGYVGHGQLIKAILVTLVQGLGLYYLGVAGIPNLMKFGTLGTVQMEMVFNPVTFKNEVNDYDNSFAILLLSIIAMVVIVAMMAAAMAVVASNYHLQMIRKAGGKTNSFAQDVRVYLNEKFYITLLTLPVLGVVVFTIVPLFILIAVAFTNYDQQHMPPNSLFTWVGLANFFTLFGGGQSLSLTFGYAFGKVLVWTLVWAFFATFTNFFGGVFLAMFINDKKTKFPKLWRTLFVITIAVPQFVTLLLVRNFFGDNGIFNTMMSQIGVTDLLHNIGLLSPNMDYIPFLTSNGWAQVMIILINIWVGVPYQMLIATGVLMNIPGDMLEAARIDGANPVQMFFRIKLPYLLSVQGPSLVTDFVKNINNFNVIYLLTQDVYVTADQAMASSSAKEVDLLVTWLFRLTQEQYNYKMAAVIGIMVFIICAVFTVVCFRFINKKEATFS